MLAELVKGAVTGTCSRLSSFDVNGNRAVDLDFRTLLPDVIPAMGGNPRAMPGETCPRPGFVRGEGPGC